MPLFLLLIASLSLLPSCRAPDAAATSPGAPPVGASARPASTAPGAAGVNANAADQAAIDLGRENTRLFYEGEHEALWARWAPSMQEAFVHQAVLPGLRAQVTSELGEEVELLGESVIASGGVRNYLREVRFSSIDAVIVVHWAFDADDAAVAFSVRPKPTEAPTESLDYNTKTVLRLPFDGAWHVFWGGRTHDVNYHTAYPDQRFAYDFLIMEDGRSHTGDGTQNVQYHCFGRPIVAPGDGTVVAVANCVPDNVPGEMNAAQPLGNHVILDHGNGEWSFFAHFQRGTVAVEKGQVVRAGERLGLCGNSGNSSEPHLHYHLQDTPVPLGGKGLPPQFQRYTGDDRWVERGEPVKGQTVAHRPVRGGASDAGRAGDGGDDDDA